jgi:AAA+ superfamily predicted ATPase
MRPNRAGLKLLPRCRRHLRSRDGEHDSGRVPRNSGTAISASHRLTRTHSRSYRRPTSVDRDKNAMLDAALALATHPCPPRTPDPVADNAAALDREIRWFDEVLSTRLALHFGQECPYRAITDIPAPDLEHDDSAYARFVREQHFGFDERVVLMLALVPHLRPNLLDTLCVRNSNLERGFTEFGGWKGRAHGGFLPTLETAAFVLTGENLRARLSIGKLFNEGHALHQLGILRISHDTPGEPRFSAPLRLAQEYLDLLTTGQRHKPDYSASFPAKRITTALEWSDLVLAEESREEIDMIITWVRHGVRIMGEWRLEKAIKPGYRSLFFGPPGTGKTLTATLIGQAAQTDVYRIDLSLVVSKYIGETEKNLAHVFDQAHSRGWLLFFDEADALFGKRTATSSAHDRYANQEVSYLLQRIEDFPGVVILATNLKDNIDDAFARRFQSQIHFPMPDAAQRRRLWDGMARHTDRLDADIDLAALAETYELSGGAIANIVRYGAISALQAGRGRIGAADLHNGIVKELRKEGKTVTARAPVPRLRITARLPINP